MIDISADLSDAVVKERVAGKSIRTIAKMHDISVATVNTIIDRWADSELHEKLRKHSLCLELMRLDELTTVFHVMAAEGDTVAGALTLKISERRGQLLGLHVPQTQVLQIVDAASKEPSTTDKIEQAIRGLLADQDRKDDDPTTH